MRGRDDGRDTFVDIPDTCESNCPIVLDGISCDGFVRGMSVGAITHFHQDHIGGMRGMMAAYKCVVVHPVTFAALAVLNAAVGYGNLFCKAEYGDGVSIPGGTVRLLPANHIPGSCQVLVEHGGKRLLYSGDFNYPDAEPPKCDCLVLDATHGNPSYEQEGNRHGILDQMLDRVAANAEAGRSAVVSASRGTLQEIMGHFWNSPDRLPGSMVHISHSTEIGIFNAIYGKNQDRGTGGTSVLDRLSAEAKDALSGGRPCILFTSSMRIDAGTEKFFRVQVGRFGSTVGRHSIQDVEGGIRCDFPSHSDYGGILEYVRRADPEFVLTDSSRSGSAAYLASRIRDTLHINAKASGDVR